MKKAIRSAEQTKRRLLDSGKRQFAEHGYHGATVHSIAARAGVNISLISHHFGGKEGLYRCCLEGFGQKRIEAIERYLEPPRSAEELRIRLELLADDFLVMHLKEPDLVAILLRDVNAQHLWGKDLEELLFGFSAKIAGFVDKAKQAGLVRSEVDPLVVAGVIYLAFSGLMQVSGHVERVTGLQVADEATRKILVRKTIDVICSGILEKRC